MYSTERYPDGDVNGTEAWAILDLDGDMITYVLSEGAARDLLSHLNR